MAQPMALFLSAQRYLGTRGVLETLSSTTTNAPQRGLSTGLTMVRSRRACNNGQRMRNRESEHVALADTQSTAEERFDEQPRLVLPSIWWPAK